MRADRFRRAAVFVAAGTSCSLLVTVGVAQAHDGPVTVANRLDSPRGLAFGPGGSLYVAKAGRGGAGPCFPGPEGGEVCFGDSGAVSRIRGRSAYVSNCGTCAGTGSVVRVPL